jgi:putative hydrolase of the HAD superfamily
MPTLPDGTPLRALLLDLDDTLLDARSGVGAAWEHVAGVLAEAHPDLAPDALRAEIHRVTDWFWTDAERHRVGRLDLAAARREILGRVLAAFDRSDPELVARAAQVYHAHRDASLRLEADALEVLARLRRAVPLLGLVTNGAADAQRAKVERFDLARFFDHVQIEGEFGAGKPERHVFEHALGVLDVSPEQALMAGDDFTCDVLGALAAGLHAAWLDHAGDGAPPGRAPRPFHVLRSLQDLAALLGI